MRHGHSLGSAPQSLCGRLAITSEQVWRGMQMVTGTELGQLVFPIEQVVGVIGWFVTPLK